MFGIFFICSLLVSSALADFDHFASRSFFDKENDEFSMDEAAVRVYGMVSAEKTFEPQAGIVLNEGNILCVGNFQEKVSKKQKKPISRAFVTKLSPSGEKLWSWFSADPYVAKSVVELKGLGAVLAIGSKLTLLDSSNGEEIWTSSLQATSAHVTEQDVVMTTASGSILKFDMSSFKRSAPLQGYEASVFKRKGFRSKKILRLEDGDLAVLFQNSHLALLNADGTQRWTVRLSMEATDFTIADNGLIITGHRDMQGKLIKINFLGEEEWSKALRQVGNSKSECFGVASLGQDLGFALSCRTGTLSCSNMNKAQKKECTKQLGVWSTLAVRTDSLGNVIFQRADQYRDKASPKMGEPGWKLRSSELRSVVHPRDGGILFMTREQGGLGVLILGAKKKAPSPTRAPAETSPPAKDPSSPCTKHKKPGQCSNEVGCVWSKHVTIKKRLLGFLTTKAPGGNDGKPVTKPIDDKKPGKKKPKGECVRKVVAAPTNPAVNRCRKFSKKKDCKAKACKWKRGKCL